MYKNVEVKTRKGTQEKELMNKGLNKGLIDCNYSALFLIHTELKSKSRITSCPNVPLFSSAFQNAAKQRNAEKRQIPHRAGFAAFCIPHERHSKKRNTMRNFYRASISLLIVDSRLKCRCTASRTAGHAGMTYTISR